MTESSKLEHKQKGLLRYIVERLFCHHTMIETFKVEVKDSNGYIEGINATLLCEECGKVKNIRI